MYSIFDFVYFMMLDFINRNLVYVVILITFFNIFGFCFFRRPR